MAVALPRGGEGKGGKPIHPLLRPFPPSSCVLPTLSNNARKKTFPFSPSPFSSHMHVISVPFFRTPFSSQTFFRIPLYGLQVL